MALCDITILYANYEHSLNCFFHDHNAKIRLGRRIHLKTWKKNTFEEVKRTREEGAGRTTEQGSKLGVHSEPMFMQMLHNNLTW